MLYVYRLKRACSGSAGQEECVTTMCRHWWIVALIINIEWIVRVECQTMRITSPASHANRIIHGTRSPVSKVWQAAQTGGIAGEVVPMYDNPEDSGWEKVSRGCSRSIVLAQQQSLAGRIGKCRCPHSLSETHSAPSWFYYVSLQCSSDGVHAPSRRSKRRLLELAWQR